MMELFRITAVLLLVSIQLHLRECKELLLPLSVAEQVTLEPLKPAQIGLKDSPGPTHAFWLFEAHTQDLNVTISTYNNNSSSQESTGNHVGLVLERGQGGRPTVFLENPHPGLNLSVILYVRAYSQEHPLPGKGRRPDLNVTWDQNLVTLDFASAGSLKHDKDERIFTYQVYQYYLAERNFDEQTFLEGLSTSMLSIDDVELHGVRVNGDLLSRHDNKSVENRVVFAAYPGTAELFAVVAMTSWTDDNGTQITAKSMYVTTGTYACHLLEQGPDDTCSCQSLWYTITKVICGVSVFIGAFLALFGHRCFLVSQPFVGLYLGSVVGFILVSLIYGPPTDMWHYNLQVGLSFIGGGIGALLLFFLWYTCGLPLLSTFFSTVSLGLLLGAIFVFLPVMNLTSMTGDLVYWLSIGAFGLGTPLAILAFTRTASILSLVVIGTYIFMVPIDHYIGTSLKYILVNVLRRSYVPDFNYAVIYPPFQANDVAMVCGWVGLVIITYTVQYMRERKRAPFPPNPLQQRRWRQETSENLANDAEDELRPLLSVQHVAVHHATSEARMTTSTSSSSNTTTSRNPVVGYIASRNRSSRGEHREPHYGAVRATSPLLRDLSSPTLYEDQPRVAVQTSPVRSRLWPLRQTVEPVQQMSTSAEERDLFRPPPGHPSQK